jgi:dihydroorotate dehydrogenase electron transfer subunit
MRLEEASVAGQRNLTGGYRWLEIDAPGVAAAAEPGQFVHVRVPGLDPLSLRRPFSICGAESGRVAILYKEVGRGTAAMGRLRTGACVSLIGPLGKGFPRETGGRPVLLVAGGYGVAPLLFLARRLPDRGRLFVGGRSRADVLLTDAFAKLGWTVETATEDGSRGTRGFVTVLLDAWFEAHPDGRPVLYACGPDGLLRAVAGRAADRGLDAWVSLDKHMVCGVGACLACVQALRRPDGTTWIGRVCRDGPVFEGRSVIWEAET